MELREMEIAQLEQRKSEIAGEVDQEDANLDALETEVREINSEIERRIAEQNKKEEIRKAVLEGQGQSIEKKEERKMVDTIKVDSREYRDLWLRNLQGNLTKEERTNYGFTQTGTYSTNAVPTIIADRFIEKIKKLAPMLDEITLLRVAGNLQFVAEGTRNTASSHTENASINPAQDTTVKVTLGAVEFVKILGISKSAKLMSIDEFENWLVEILAGDIARAIDNYILNDSSNGISAGTYTTNTNQILNTASSGYTYGNIVSLIALLPAGYDAEAKFLVHKSTLWNKIANIVNSSGNPIFVPDTREGMAGRLMGYPVVVDDYVSTSNNALYLGAWRNVVGNLSEGINVDVDESAGFKEAQMLYRGYASFDSKVANSEAIVRLVSTTA